ncbi:Lysosomal alpha-mannosidase [Chionoecetes opilio]|uniref:Lysosomal alpha-mannosidase n=1 Tax=Chionoecetes opilio TaxID=41210 RepID=A0A8J4XQQ8_CHIOP|nr:Lysosomal alpha-mannosidase [Chionoecetes opilio]
MGVMGEAHRWVMGGYQVVMGEAISKLQPPEAVVMSKGKDEATPVLCPLLNISSCPITESAPSFITTVYNPVARPVTHYVRLPVSEDAAFKRALLLLTIEGWEIAFQWVPSYAGIPGNEVADSAARMVLTDVNTTPFPLPLSAAKCLISRVCRSTWNNMLGDTLRITSMGQYRSDSSPQPWIRKKSRVLDVTLTRLRLGHTTLTLTCIASVCPLTPTAFVLQSQLLALNVTTFDLPTLLAAAGVPPSRQHAVIRLTCAFLRKTGNAVKTQLVPIPKPVLATPGRKSSATFELVFPAADIPPLGLLRFYIQRTHNRRFLRQQMSKVQSRQLGGETPIILATENLTLVVDPHTGLLKMVGAVHPGAINMIPVSQNFFVYAGMSGNNSKEDFRASGAYIFRPNGSEAAKVSDKVEVVTIEGPLVYEVQQQWGPWVSQVLRAYMGRTNLEMEWLVGPIPVEDGVGREVVSRVDWADLTTGNTFYTDSNGREMLKRVKDYRPTWNLKNQEPVAGNYYPVNSRLILDNGTLFKAAILTDRSQGGSSLQPGQMELMVHRRLLHDDAFGVGEALNETQFGEGLVARGKHFLLHSTFADRNCDFGCLHRSLGEELLLPPLYLFEETTASVHAWKESAVNKWSGLGRSLPNNVHLLTLEPWGDNRLLLRLEHMYATGESQPHSNPATVSLKGLLADWEIVDVEEMILSANLKKKDENRLNWKVKESGKPVSQSKPHSRSDNSVHQEDPSTKEDPLSITLSAMEIRTFILTVKKSSTRF